MTNANHSLDQTQSNTKEVNRSVTLSGVNDKDKKEDTNSEIFMVRQEQLATHSERFIAYVIDILFLDTVIIFLLFLLGVSFFEKIGNAGSGYNENLILENPSIEPNMYLFAFLLMQIPFLFLTFLESSKLKASLGKLTLGMLVIDKQGSQLSFFHVYLRNVIKYLVFPFFPPIILIQFILKNRQGLQDLIMAKSYVVDKQKFEIHPADKRNGSALINMEKKNTSNSIN